jgi:hypothetical protein
MPLYNKIINCGKNKNDTIDPRTMAAFAKAYRISGHFMRLHRRQTRGTAV